MAQQEVGLDWQKCVVNGPVRDIGLTEGKMAVRSIVGVEAVRAEWCTD